MKKIITIEENIGIPKYRQIINSVEEKIAEKIIKKGDKLPSINKVCLEFKISRDTVMLAYDELKKRGILHAILGKGYYIKSVEFSFEKRIFLLFDEFNSFKEDLYNSFLEHMKNNAQIDIFFHHFNTEMFKKLVNESHGNYSKYVIMPSNLKGIADTIKSLPKNDVYILDQTNELLNEFPSVHQNFIEDMYNGLKQGQHLLNKYQKFVLIFPGNKEPLGMVDGFLKFCNEFEYQNEIIHDFDKQIIDKGTLFIIPSDRHLVNVIEQGKIQSYILGENYGVISYNDTVLKKIVGNGISTISTDFYAMGKILAEMILENSKNQVQNHSKLILRNSF